VEGLRTSLLSEEKNTKYIQFYLDAVNAFEQASYHVVVIHAVTALESLVKSFLNLYLQYDNNLKTKILEMQLYNLVTEIMPLIFGSADYTKLQNEITKDIRLRNQIIHKHEAELDVPKDRARKVIENVNKYMEFIFEKIRSLNGSLGQPVKDNVY
jgi:HEPN domain-containing protein